MLVQAIVLAFIMLDQEVQRIKVGMIRREGTDANKPTSTQLLHIEFNLVSPEAKSKCKSAVCVIYLRYCSRTHNKS